MKRPTAQQLAQAIVQRAAMLAESDDHEPESLTSREWQPYLQQAIDQVLEEQQVTL